MDKSEKILSSRKLFIFNVAFISLIIGFAIASIFYFSLSGPDPLNGNTVQAQDMSRTATGLQSLENLQYSFREVAGKALPSVVEITTTTLVTESFQGTVPNDLFGPRGNQRQFPRQGLGSGVIVRKTGGKVYVLTNNHVVNGADQIMVNLYDGREFEAAIVGTDARIDLGVVVFETREDVPIAVLGDSDKLQVGDWVLAMGNPFGFESTVTAGIVSAVAREAQLIPSIPNYTDYIQTDAAINQGNSGGALVNITGEVIGINTWIASETGGYMGLGFAIPIDNAKNAIDQIIEKGKIEYGWLGVSTDPGFESISGITESLNIEDMRGALVLNVFTGSPAEKSGILPGDFIVKAGDIDIRDWDHLTRVIGTAPPGKTINFTVIRYGEKKNLGVELGERGREEERQSDTNYFPGMTVLTLDSEVRKELDLPRNINGVVVFRVYSGTQAEAAGFYSYDVITRIDDNSIGSVLDFYENLNSIGRQEAKLHIYREGEEIVLGFKR